LSHIPQLAANNRQHFLKVKNNREQFPSAVSEALKRRRGVFKRTLRGMKEQKLCPK